MMPTIKQLTGTFAAEVSGVDLAERLSDDLVGTISDALDEHKLLVFRDQHAVGPDELLAAARCFGDPEEVDHPQHEAYPGLPGVKLIALDGQYHRDTWHTDGSTRVDTAWLTFLHGVTIPEYGRDTMFADMEAVFARLSPRMQDFLDGMTALHSWGRQQPDAPPVEHPVVSEDKRTGRKWLYVNRIYTRSLVGLSDSESTTILEYLLQQVQVPEVQYRLHWTPGTIALWDNESTQHYLVHDRIFDRVMHRVMVVPRPGIMRF